MRSMILLAALLGLAPFGAQAADITVYSPGIVNGPLKQLAQAWSAETGNKVEFAGNNVGRIRTAVTTDAPGDVVVAPPRTSRISRPSWRQAANGRWAASSSASWSRPAGPIPISHPMRNS